ncbi:tetratricopeptide repeat protein [Methylobacterium sp. NEAU 140]|uniref:tetratricopeptide repeat protein n=1 Tax=Methylobacterium sp. NEAU 140 TaxID=3064945 RepID=UPI002732DC2B|nr:tetratricopeptide repeat protein [Methylobacterium sp. NEAU 140]MDP4022762.1 tetratricopeptide repeat protein [Methylobacterium sp. NEAU 140]
MAQNNEFIREVDEDYRRDRILQIWRRYSGVIIAVAVLLVAGVAGWRYWEAQQRAAAETASVQFDDANRLAREGKTAEADKAYDALEAQGPAGYRLLARFRSAAETAKADPAKGAAEYDKLAEDTALGDGLRDLARLRAALIRMDGADPAPALASLQGLAAGTPFRHTAREMLGLAALKKGDYEEAGRWFDQIVADPETPRNLRERIEVYAAIVAGGPVTVTEAKPEPAAPPPPITR